MYSTNSCLRGAQKEAIGGLVGLLIVGTILAAFLVLGWQLGLVSIVAVMVLIPLVQPFARFIARSLLGYRTGPEVVRAPNIFDRLEKGEGMVSIFARMGQERDADRARLARILERSQISDALRRKRLSSGDFEVVFTFCRSLASMIWHGNHLKPKGH